jgi:mRNA interferase MazF
MIRRGDVVIVDIPFTDTGQSKVRPAVIVQNDRDNGRITKTLVAIVTGNLRRQGDPSHVLVDPGDPDGASSGLSYPSLVSCTNLFTINKIPSSIGHLSNVLMQRLDAALRSALEL